MIAPRNFAQNLQPAKSTKIFQLKITLEGVNPPVWRRVKVPARANLGWLHAVIQTAMGWCNSHLHQFLVGKKIYSDPRFQLDEMGGLPSVLDETSMTLEGIFSRPKDLAIYEYDFGDSWFHGVQLEKILDPEKGRTPKAVCIEGEGGCPPEDCGGIGGYEELVKILKNKRHREHRAMKKWVGPSFDPDRFDLVRTNACLKLLKWPKTSDRALRTILMMRDSRSRSA